MPSIDKRNAEKRDVLMVWVCYCNSGGKLEGAGKDRTHEFLVADLN